MPMTPLSGVRSSWHMLARNRLLARLASSAAARRRSRSLGALLDLLLERVGEAAELPVALAQGQPHGVEGAGEPADLVVVRVGHGRLEIPAGEGLAGVGQAVQPAHPRRPGSGTGPATRPPPRRRSPPPSPGVCCRRASTAGAVETPTTTDPAAAAAGRARRRRLRGPGAAVGRCRPPPKPSRRGRGSTPASSANSSPCAGGSTAARRRRTARRRPVRGECVPGAGVAHGAGQSRPAARRAGSAEGRSGEDRDEQHVLVAQEAVGQPRQLPRVAHRQRQLRRPGETQRHGVGGAVLLGGDLPAHLQHPGRRHHRQRQRRDGHGHAGRLGAEAQVANTSWGSACVPFNSPVGKRTPPAGPRARERPPPVAWRRSG